MANSLGSTHGSTHGSTLTRPAPYPASLALMLALATKPFLTPYEESRAREIDTKQQEFVQRGEDLDPARVQEFINKMNRDFAEGTSDELPLDHADARVRLHHAQRAVLNAHCEFIQEAGISALCTPIYDRAKAIVAALLERLEAQEQAEAHALEIPYDPSGTVLAVRVVLDRFEGMTRELLRYSNPDGNPAPVRWALKGFMDFDAAPQQPPQQPAGAGKPPRAKTYASDEKAASLAQTPEEPFDQGDGK